MNGFQFGTSFRCLLLVILLGSVACTRSGQTQNQTQDSRTPASENTRDDDCPSNDFPLETIPGVDPNDPRTYSKDQGHTNWCMLYSGTDLLCSTMKTHNSWPSGPLYDQGCSTLELGLQSADTASKSLKQLSLQGYAFPDMLEVARTKGVCPESVFPSKYISDSNATLKDIKESLKRRVSDNVSVEGRVDLPGYCKECGVTPIDPSKFQKISDVIDNVHNSDSEVSALRRVADILCEGKRIKISRNIKFHTKGNTPYPPDTLNRKLRENKPVLVSVPASDLFTNRDGGHSMLVLQGDLAGHKCFYSMKNSWGQSCKPTSKPTNPPPIFCDKQTNLYLIESREWGVDRIGMIFEVTKESVDCARESTCI